MNLQRKTLPRFLLVLAVLWALPGDPAHAGGSLLGLDFTQTMPSPNPGEATADLVPKRWDPRCIPVEFRLNDTQDPVPDPTGLGALPLADAAVVLQDALDRWNRIPTSFIDMRLTGTTSNPGFAHFDFVNEVTFRTDLPAGVLAVSSVASLCEDAELPDGLDLDGDGDSDVAAGIATCQDADGDGDVELPAGWYAAGTILSNDVLFNAATFRFATTPDNTLESVDLEAIAVHEFGHSHGLAHTLINQISATEPDSATMFPLVDTDDPATQFAMRTLHTEEVAFSSFFYPEGTAAAGPAALQPGDIPFAEVFGVVQGTVTDGTFGGPLVGASVTARDQETGALVASVYSGHARTSYDAAARSQRLVEDDPAFHFLDGKYALPLPAGQYELFIEAVDGTPLLAEAANDAVKISAALGRQNFQPDGFALPRDRAFEVRPDRITPVAVPAGRTVRRIDFISNDQVTLAPFGSLDQLGFPEAPGGTFYAVAFPVADLLATTGEEPFALTTGLFYTSVFDSSVAPIFERALLTRCTVQGTAATVDLAHPLREVAPFVGREGDLTPFPFTRTVSLGLQIFDEARRGTLSHLCLVLEVPPPPYAGISAVPPLIGLDGQEGQPDNDTMIAGLSFQSDDGELFEASPFSNFLFALVATPLVRE